MEKGDGCFFRTGFLETMSGATEHSVVVAKAEARQESRARLESMPVAVREEGSRRIVAGVRAQPIWREAKRVLLFAPIQLEPDVRGLCEVGMKEGKQICLPRWDGREYVAAWMKRGWADCVAGQFGILEPCSDGETLSLNPLDLVLVPGIAWTRCGLRLGRGKGYYDRLLAATGGIHCGVAFDEQVVAELPFEAHDVRVEFLFTPSGCWRCRSAQAD